jgi:AraC-like DNA-binding protein
MRYAEHRPSPPLAGRVECFWFAEDPEAKAGPTERVLPDGCIEWIFHLARPYLDASGRLQPASFVAGPTTRPISITPSGPVATLGVRFRPGGARGLLPPLSQFADAFPTPREVWGIAAGSIEDEVAEARGLKARAAVLERFLEKRRAGERSEGARLSAAIRLILSARGRATIAAIARRVGCTPRQLEREFAEGVGLSPKQLSRVVRFQNLLRLAGRNPDAGWAELALRCGYADQAHLVREFKGFSGATPGSKRETDGALARHFIDPVRLEILLSPVAFVQDARSTTA